MDSSLSHKLWQYVSGEVPSDPTRVSTLIISAMREWYGVLDEPRRTELLRPLAQLAVVSQTRWGEVQRRCAFRALDWYIRVAAPEWLGGVDAYSEHVAAIRRCPEIVSERELPGGVLNRLHLAADRISLPADANWSEARRIERAAGGAPFEPVVFISNYTPTIAYAWRCVEVASTKAILVMPPGEVSATVSRLQESASQLLRSLCFMTTPQS